MSKKMMQTALAIAMVAAFGAMACAPSSTSVPEATEAAVDAREAELALREQEVLQREAAARESQPARAAVAPTQAPQVPTPAAPRTIEPTAAATAPTRHVAPTPKTVNVQVPAGTTLDLETVTSLSTGTSQVGDRFRARIVSDVMAGNVLAIPAGTEVAGTVTEVVPLKKFGGQPQIALSFDAVELTSGDVVPIRASLHDAGKKQTGRDAAKIGAGAAAGAVIGHQVDDDRGKLIGAVIGGAVGTAVAAKTGKELELPAGTAVSVAIEEAIEVPVMR